MRESWRRLLVGLVVVAVIGIIPMMVLASSGNSAAAKPTVSHGPKRTPTPTPTPTASPTVAPTAGPPAVLVGAGDIAYCATSGDEATAALLGSIGGTIFTLGDNVYDNGTATEFTNCYGPSWGQPGIYSRTRPVVGNHDYNTAGAAGYYGYFGPAAGDPTKGYYAYALGTWRVYVLNSNCSIVSCAAGSAQEQWLRGDLAANPAACVVAMWHHPRFSSGTSHGSSTTVQPLYQALYDNNAELVMSGHEHNYERFAPQTPTGALDNARGIVQFVVGTGGRSHYLFGTPLTNSLVRNSDTFGVLRLGLSANSWTSDFIPVAGQTFRDSGSGTCH